MNIMDIANGMIFNKLNISKDTFEDRLISQKKIYLLQSLGTNLGYLYNWYVRGPYSPSLTNYIYNNLDILLTQNYTNHTLTDKVIRDIEIINSLKENKPNNLNLSDAEWYELLGSIVYIYNNKSSWNIDNSEKKLSQKLIEQKPQFTEAHCTTAIEVLQKEKFII